MEKRSSVTVNVLWNTFGTIFYCLAQWIITILVVRIDSFEASGQLSLAMTTSSTFSAISLFSMRNYQVSDVDEKYKTAHYLGSRVVTCVMAFVLCTAYSLVSHFTVYQLGCVLFFMLVRIVEAVVDVLHGINQKYDRYDTIGKSYVLRGMVTVVLFSIVLYMSHDMLMTLGIMALGNALVAVLFDFRSTYSYEKLSPVIKDRQIVELLVTCIPLAIAAFFLSSENLVSKTALQNMFGEEALGIYASIASPTLVVQVGASVIFNPFLPSYIRVYNDGEYNKFRKMFHKVLLAIMGMAILVAICAAVVGRLGLSILYGTSILQYYELFMPIVWSTIVLAAVWILQAIVIGIRRIYPMLVGIVADAAICFVSCDWFLQQFSWNGASYVQVMSLLLLTIYLIVICEVDLYGKIKNRKR